MTEEKFNKIIKEINITENTNLDFSFKDFNSCVKMIKDKINYNKNIYKKNKELYDLSELCIIIWGLLSFSTIDKTSDDSEDKLPMIFHALTAQISNNLLSIVILCNKSLDHQVGILMRSTCELCFTLLVIILNKEKQIKYFNTARLNNEQQIWKEEFRLSILNQELEKNEKEIIKDDYPLLKEIKKYRSEIYKHYSTYTHNSFLRCLLNSYTYSKNSKETLRFNVWGEESTRDDKFLISLCKLCFFTYSELFYYLVKKTKIQEFIFKSEESKEMWQSAIKFYLVFKTYIKDVIKD